MASEPFRSRVPSTTASQPDGSAVALPSRSVPALMATPPLKVLSPERYIHVWPSTTRPSVPAGPSASEPEKVRPLNAPSTSSTVSVEAVVPPSVTVPPEAASGSLRAATVWSKPLRSRVPSAAITTSPAPVPLGRASSTASFTVPAAIVVPCVQPFPALESVKTPLPILSSDISSTEAPGAVVPIWPENSLVASPSPTVRVLPAPT